MSIQQVTIGYDEAHEIAEDLGADLRPDYSAGGTIGQGCLGLVTNDPLKLMFKIGQRRVSLPRQPVTSALPWEDAQLDGMGLSYVIYWPGIEVESELVADNRSGVEDVRHNGVGASGWGW
jgi:hypothetical protein